MTVSEVQAGGRIALQFHTGSDGNQLVGWNLRIGKVAQQAAVQAHPCRQTRNRRWRQEAAQRLRKHHRDRSRTDQDRSGSDGGRPPAAAGTQGR